MILKNKFLLFMPLLLILSSCDGNKPSAVVSNTPSSTLKTSISPSAVEISPTPDPFEKYKNLERVSKYNIFCENFDEKNVELKLKYPTDLAVTKDGNTVYVVDRRCELTSLPFKDCQESNSDNPVIKRGFIFKVASKGVEDIVKINGVPPVSCTLEDEIELDEENNLYISDTFNSKLYRILSDFSSFTQLAEVIITGITDAGIETKLNGPKDIHVVDKNNIYFSMKSFTTNVESSIRKLEPDGKTKNIFGFFLSSFDFFHFSVYKNRIYFSNFSAMFIDSNGNYTGSGIGLTNDDIDKTMKWRVFRTKANSKGEIFASDISSHNIWKFNPDVGMTKFAGSEKAGFKDGKGEEAEFNFPTGLSFDAQDNLYVADTGNNAIRKITPDGTVSTFYAQNIINIGDKQ